MKFHLRWFTTLILTAATSLLPAERLAQNFNADWRLHIGDPEGAETASFDDSSWKPVTLPRPWNEDDAFRVDITELPTGIAWYRKSFNLPGGPADRKVFVEFEGLRQGGEFFINGHSLGFHDDGVTAIGFDLTPHLK